MNVVEKVKEYKGQAKLILAFKDELLKNKPLSTGQLILARQILMREAIEKDDKSLIKQELKQFKIDWEKYSHRMPYSFQKEGVNFLLNKSHAILADEMGTGKGIQVVLAALEKGAKKILVICPNILKLTLQREIGFYDNIENTHVCYSKDFDCSKKWTIINYDIVNKYKEELKKGKFDLLICDEAQNLKSSITKRSRAVKTIATKCKNVWLLTGTPIANRPIDFYALLKLCKHPVGSDKAYYTKQYCGGELNPFGFGYKSDGASNLKELHFKTQDVLLRRLKKDCLDLPDKILTPIVLKLRNQSQYDNAPTERVNELYLESLDPDSEKYGRDVDQGLAFVEVAVWRKYCALEKLKDGTIEEGINEVLERGEKVVIFTNYLEVIDTLAERLGEFCLTLDGRVDLEERQRRIDLFQNDPKYNKMVVNIKVGNAGLTLTAANNVFYNDLPWSPAELSQSIDRLHRIGQKLQVNVNFFIYKTQ